MAASWRCGRLTVQLAAAVPLLSVTAVPVLAGERVALVIGNAAYAHAPALANPRNDAAHPALCLTCPTLPPAPVA